MPPQRRLLSSLIKQTHHLLVKRAAAHLKDLGIPHGYTPFFMELFKKQPLTQSELVHLIGIEQPTAVRTLFRMKRDGWIQTKVSSKDRRICLITLTEKAKRIEDDFFAAARSLNSEATKNLSISETRQMEILLDRVQSNLRPLA